MTNKETLNHLAHYLFPSLPRHGQHRRLRLHRDKDIVVIIPSYRPTQFTKSLVVDINRFNRRLHLTIILVDDCSPKENRPFFKQLQSLDRKRVKVIRTPNNYLKAGAINFGLAYIEKHRIPCDIVFTFDDDVKVTELTLEAMIRKLLSDKSLGAVCSESRVANKNLNLLTRLQALEYHSFNIIRVADNNYLQGPLVMHGMASAFRYKAIKEIGGFTSGHLIEDYDITARLKNNDWLVAIAPKAVAYTLAPETIPQLWRQRVRWNTGGLKVLFGRHRPMSVLQDILGHSLFVSTFVLIIVSIAMPHDTGHNVSNTILFMLSVLTFILSYLFSLLTLSFYKEADIYDVAIRYSVIIELIYSLLLTLVLLGSYLFSSYISLKRLFFRAPERRLRSVDALFRKLGFSESWGTR